ncbi:uncharacterized protein METZ01_LOCUS465017, partial [marine metagenome]
VALALNSGALVGTFLRGSAQAGSE